MNWTRRQIIQGASAAVLASAVQAKGPPESPDWYRRGIIIDGLSRASDSPATEVQLRLSERAWEEIRSSGVTAVNQTIQPAGNYPNFWTEHLKQLEWTDRVVAANPDRLRRVDSISDIIAAKKASQVAIIYGNQDTAMIGTALERLSEMKKRGIRIVQLTYNLRNLSGDGALEPANAGLSKLGVATIERIESERLLLDLSHGGEQTIREAIALAMRPMTISHTGCRNVYDHPRNVWDSELKAVADKGGVAGIYFMAFLAPNSRATSTDLIAHIEHASNVCGEDHIGIGTDGAITPMPLDAAMLKQIREFNAERAKRGVAAPGEESPEFTPVVVDLNVPNRLQLLAEQLERRGWRSTRLEKLFGGNLLRLYREAWQ